MITKEEISVAYQQIQDEICKGLEQLDGKARFQEDKWQREGGGGGRTRVIRNGDLLEKGGVNFSEVHGELPAALKEEFKNGKHFFATGVSIVLHPHNPHVPIIHMNIRYFEVDSGERWFGGGIDLTPHYIVPGKATLFHERMKSVCDATHADFYNRFSKWADDYFFLSHRNETRGIGGIFYDHLKADDSLTWEQIFSFSCQVGRTFVPAYSEQTTERDRPFSEQQKQWQLLRRGRYVEFNLVHDRGTRFGLLTGGRTESILMSLPALAAWEYDFHPESGSEEAKTLAGLQKGTFRLS